MKVLVIIPTHDRVEFVDEAIQSVHAQTRKADELVVIGNVGPGVRSDAGLAERLNSTIEASDCDSFLVLSDDDSLGPAYIERTTAEMEARGVDIVYTDCVLFGERNGFGTALGDWTRENIERNTVPLVTSLCSKRAWGSAGGFANVPFFDWHFWWKCFYTGATAYWLREHLWNYRAHHVDKEQMDKHRRELLAIHDEMRPRFLA